MRSLLWTVARLWPVVFLLLVLLMPWIARAQNGSPASAHSSSSSCTDCSMQNLNVKGDAGVGGYLDVLRDVHTHGDAGVDGELGVSGSIRSSGQNLVGPDAVIGMFTTDTTFGFASSSWFDSSGGGGTVEGGILGITRDLSGFNRSGALLLDMNRDGTGAGSASFFAVRPHPNALTTDLVVAHSGRVGIGDFGVNTPVDPSALLHVKGTGRFDGVLEAVGNLQLDANLVDSSGSSRFSAPDGASITLRSEGGGTGLATSFILDTSVAQIGGDKLWSLRNNGTEEAWFGFDGRANFAGALTVGAVTAGGDMKADTGASRNLGASNDLWNHLYAIDARDSANASRIAWGAAQPVALVGGAKITAATLPTCTAATSDSTHVPESTGWTVAGSAGTKTAWCGCTYDGTNAKWLSLCGGGPGTATTCPACP